MRFKKLAKFIIYSAMYEFSFILYKNFKRVCIEYKEFDGIELFVSSKTGYWKLVD
ncbi:MAG: hypothetical protein ACLTUR_06785 [Paraclostridium sordellii]|uniref:hypothetical protein n=1 Tax=Paraclostridium sordellii TaxID=1505 RepID=UPI000AE73801|nr:hypothetical protein [Paeniclostridium sordellii]